MRGPENTEILSPDLREKRIRREETVKKLLLPWTEGECPSPGAADEWFMDASLALARQAATEGEVPVGCVIAREGRILVGDYNGRETFKNALRHAETSAIEKACSLLGGWRLPGCVLYVTLEPCPMCAGAIWNARIPRTVIGTKDPKAGAMGSLLNLASYPLNHRVETVFGVREKECGAVLREFFEARRK